MKILKINLADFGNLFQSDPAKLPDQELLSLDLILHRAWAMKRDGHQIVENGEDWTSLVCSNSTSPFTTR